MRRLFRLIGVTLATALVVTGALPAPASAAGKRHTFTLKDGVVMRVKDDDRHDKIGEWIALQHTFTMPPAVSWDWWNCAGGEARGVMELSAKPVSGSPGHAAVTVSVHLYEGSNCSPGDWENSEIRVFSMEPNTTLEQHIHVRTRERCGGPFNRHRCADYVDVKFTLSNEYK